jgi:hypothetical protein
MQRVLSQYFSLAVTAATFTACGPVPDYMDDPSRGISADIDAVHWDGPTIDNPGETIELRGEPNGAIPWHIN